MRIQPIYRLTSTTGSGQPPLFQPELVKLLIRDQHGTTFAAQLGVFEFTVAKTKRCSLSKRCLPTGKLNRKTPITTAMFAELMLIDSDQEILDTFHRFLERQGYSIATAASGVEATRQLRLRRPDLIVIEPVLPNDWGERVLEQYRQTAAGVPVIGLSKRRSSSLEFPFSVFHVKPVSLALLLESIQTALHSSGLEMLS